MILKRSIGCEQLMFFVFNPALVGSKLANTITYKSLISLCFMPVNILLTFIIGSVLRWVLIIIAKLPQHLKGLIHGTCSAGTYPYHTAATH
ncbi:putative membrane transport protein [Helianthus debilis subsp. tardiflorus]